MLLQVISVSVSVIGFRPSGIVCIVTLGLLEISPLTAGIRQLPSTLLDTGPATLIDFAGNKLLDPGAFLRHLMGQHGND